MSRLPVNAVDAQSTELRLQARLSDLEKRLAVFESPSGAITRRPPICRVRAGATTTVASGTVPQSSAAFPFTTPIVSGTDGGMWNASTLHIDIPVSGYYLVAFEVIWGVESAVGARDVMAAYTGGRICEDRQVGSTAVNVWCQGSQVVSLSAGDAVRLCVSQNSGVNMTVGLTAVNAPVMSVSYLSPL